MAEEKTLRLDGINLAHLAVKPPKAAGEKPRIAFRVRLLFDGAESALVTIESEELPLDDANSLIDLAARVSAETVRMLRAAAVLSPQQIQEGFVGEWNRVPKPLFPSDEPGPPSSRGR